MSVPAGDRLKVFYEGDEYPGVIAFGLAGRGHGFNPVFPKAAWDGAANYDEGRLVGAHWEIFSWEIRLKKWARSEAFKQAVRETLHQLILDGCFVSWIGAEGVPLCDPPFLFDPQCMSGGVLAWMTSSGTFDCLLDPAQPLRSADDETLRKLRSHSELAGSQ